MRAGTEPQWVVPDATQEDWLDCDQCRDCFKPAHTLRPGMSAQYGAAISNFDELDAGRPPAPLSLGLHRQSATTTAAAPAPATRSRAGSR